MKPVTLLLVSGLVTLTNGCATNHVVAWKARDHVEFDRKQQRDIRVAGQPAYYALLPLSVPFDIVTSPIQFCILLAWPAAKMPGTNGPAATKQ